MYILYSNNMMTFNIDEATSFQEEISKLKANFWKSSQYNSEFYCSYVHYLIYKYIRYVWIRLIVSSFLQSLIMEKNIIETWDTIKLNFLNCKTIVYGDDLLELSGAVCLSVRNTRNELRKQETRNNVKCQLDHVFIVKMYAVQN